MKYIPKLRALAVIAIAPLLSTCSSVGPGLAHHPVDCAVGIPWADCLAGTPGYNNGGGQQTRQEAAQTESSTITAQQQANDAQCASEMQAAELDPIRQKVELTRNINDGPPPFQLVSNDTFPTAEDHISIAKWATIRDACIKRSMAAALIPSSATPLQAAYLQQERSFGTEAAGRVNEPILSLYQGKLTYGEFTQKRYEIGRDAAAAERQFRSATLIADHDRQVQAQQAAQQQFQNNLLTWSTYMQTVNARQPQTVHVDGSVRVKTNCTSQRLGSFVDTTCN